MFEAAGFTEVARRRANASSPERPIVRLETLTKRIYVIRPVRTTVVRPG